jgi:predicted extracellular nuclease
MRTLVMAGLLVVLVRAASGGMVISEWMYSGTNGEFIEFTNTGPGAIDMTGWSFDDDSQAPGTVALSAFGVVAAGKSVILTDVAAADLATAWGLSGVSIIGGNAANLGRNDQINLYDASNNLIDQLSYGDQTYVGTPRTQNKSCNIPTADYGYAVAQTTWVLASVGDAFGSWASSGGDVASPGIAPIPEPSTLALLACCGLALARRQR